jgi:membrane protease YdiL (CAAX protease family)
MFTGYLRKKTGSYVAPIALHMINNFIAFFAIILSA